MKHKCKFTALHHEYEINRRRYNAVMYDGEDLGNLENKELGLINAATLVNYNDHVFPYVSTITTTTFPEQNSEYIGKVIPLWYIDHDTHEKTYGSFTVVRWDIGEPYRVMLINNYSKILLVTKEEWVIDQDDVEEKDEDSHVVRNSHIHLFPLQMDNLVGVKTRDTYLAEDTYIDGTIIRADAVNGENPKYVILEELDEETYRLVTFEETKPIINLYDVKPQKGFDSNRFWPDDWRNLGIYEDSTDTDTETE